MSSLASLSASLVREKNPSGENPHQYHRHSNSNVNNKLGVVREQPWDPCSDPCLDPGSDLIWIPVRIWFGSDLDPGSDLIWI
jgi:hypothetical protein